MSTVDRRDFLRSSLLAGAALSLAPRPAAGASSAATPAGASPGIIDSNVNLFRWPYRRLKYDDTAALVAKLRRHRVVEAWAGSYEALFAKDLAGVNERLAAECRTRGDGLLRAIGSVNLAWPDWEDDVRRCHEMHRMAGLRIFPGYQPFDLAHPDLPRLLDDVQQRGLLLQIVFQMEDPRIHHPLLNVAAPATRPLVAALKARPRARVQLLHFSGNLQGSDLGELMALPNVSIDISRWESNGIVGKMLGTAPSPVPARVPLERVLFGSHAPYFPVETAILKLIESPLPLEQLHAIIHRNARALIPSA